MTDPISGLLARSSPLGADQRNTDDAGGDICTKGTGTDRVTGQPVDLVRVDGSGDSGVAADFLR